MAATNVPLAQQAQVAPQAQAPQANVVQFAETPSDASNSVMDYNTKEGWMSYWRGATESL